MGFFSNPKKAIRGFTKNPLGKIATDLGKLGDKIEKKLDIRDDSSNETSENAVPASVAAPAPATPVAVENTSHAPATHEAIVNAITELLIDGLSGKSNIVNFLRQQSGDQDIKGHISECLLQNSFIEPVTATTLAKILRLDIEIAQPATPVAVAVVAEAAPQHYDTKVSAEYAPAASTTANNTKPEATTAPNHLSEENIKNNLLAVINEKDPTGECLTQLLNEFDDHPESKAFAEKLVLTEGTNFDPNKVESIVGIFGLNIQDDAHNANVIFPTDNYDTKVSGDTEHTEG